MAWYLLFKKTFTLFALVDPLLAAPMFLLATQGMTRAAQQRFARQLGWTVALALAGGGVFGLQLLSLMGISLGAIQVGGGVVAMLYAIAMVMAKEQTIRMTHEESNAAITHPGVVPLGVPLLVGPAALSFVMATSTLGSWEELAIVLVPPAILGLLVVVIFYVAIRGGRWMSTSTAQLVERLSGFFLAAIAVEMIAGGLRALFPLLDRAAG